MLTFISMFLSHSETEKRDTEWNKEDEKNTRKQGIMFWTVKKSRALVEDHLKHEDNETSLVNGIFFLK